MFQQRELPTITKRGLQRNLHHTVDYHGLRGVLKRAGREFYVVVSGGERHKIRSLDKLVIYKTVIGKPYGYSETYFVYL